MEGSQKGVLIGAGAARMVSLGGAKPHLGQGDCGDGDSRWACVAGATGQRLMQLHQVDAVDLFQEPSFDGIIGVWQIAPTTRLLATPLQD
jgi:hypothetical protein